MFFMKLLHRIFPPSHDDWFVRDFASEYALPCGHIRGQYWDYGLKAWCCIVCFQRDPRKGDFRYGQ